MTLTGVSTAKGTASVSPPAATATIVAGGEPEGPVATLGVDIVGTPVVGTTLNAVLSNVDGLDNVGSFSFRWIGDGVELPGGSHDKCLLTEGEVGKMVQVILTYTDASGVVSTVTSDPVGPVRRAAGPRFPPRLTIAPGVSPVVEGSAVEFTVTRSHAPAELPAVEVAVTETGSMLAGATWVEVRFAPGEATSLMRLETVDDAVAEADSEVRATLPAGVGYELGPETAAAVTVVDNDAAPELRIEAASAIEGAGAVEFVARLSSAAGRRLSVGWETSDATAVAGTDYLAASGVVTFAAGATEARFSVQLIDDGIAEGDEHFLVTFKEAEMAVDEPSIRATIVDDDPASALRALTLDRDRISEGEGPVALTVTAVLDRSARDVHTPVRIVVTGSGLSGAVGFEPV